MSRSWPIAGVVGGLLVGVLLRWGWTTATAAGPEVPVEPTVSAPMDYGAVDELELELRSARAAFLTSWGRPPTPPDSYDPDRIRRKLEKLLAAEGGHIYAMACEPYPCRALGIAPAGTDISVAGLGLDGATVHHQPRDGAEELVFLLAAEAPVDGHEERFVQQLGLALRSSRERAWENARREMPRNQTP